MHLSQEESEGFVYCALKQTRDNDTSYSSFEIIRDGMMNSSSNSSAVIRVNDLIPATPYTAYCFATNIGEMSVSAHQNIKATNFRTDCCKLIDIDLYHPRIYFDVDTNNAYVPNFFGVRLHHVSYDYVEIDLSISGLSCTTSPNKLVIAPSNFSSQKVYNFGIIGCSIGTHSIIATIMGSIASYYQVNYLFGRTNFSILVSQHSIQGNLGHNQVST